MKALAKLERAPGLTMTRVKRPEVGHNDVLIRIRKHGDLRHRHPHLEMGRVGAEDDSRADARRP